VVTALLAFVVAVTAETRGLCLMDTPPPAAKAHDCCPDGLRDALPPCCAMGAEAPGAARPTPPSSGIVAAAPDTHPIVTALRVDPQVTPCPSSAPRLDHSPPPILRI
jgi:hypothetical protein